MEGQKYLNSLDLTSGYWHVEMVNDSVKRQSLASRRTFCFNIFPSRIMQRSSNFWKTCASYVLAGDIGERVFAYSDDFLIAGIHFKEQISLFRDVSSAFR